MNTPTKPEQLISADRYWEALLYAVAGGVVLVGTWYFFGRRLQAPATEWYAWIRPILLTLGGSLCLVAAVLLAAGRPSGREVLQLAIITIPLVLFSGLVVLALRLIGDAVSWVSGGANLPSSDAIGDRLWSSPWKLAINVAVVAAVILLGILGRSMKSDER